MATASVSNSSECSICLDCLTLYIGDKTFICPTCQQDGNIPEGGAIDNQAPSTTQAKCPNHKQREVNYYCNNCNVGLCFRCISIPQHKEHETLDIECVETQNGAKEKLRSSQKNIQNRIKLLEKTRSALLESFEQVKSLCEDSCAEVTEKTEQIVSDLRKSCQKINKDIRKSLDENRIKVEDREMELSSEMNLLESNIDSIISLSTKPTLNILLTLPRLIELEKKGESMEDYLLYMQYLQWEGKDFSLDIDQIGSVISKPFNVLVTKPLYIPGSFQFLFDVSDIEKNNREYYGKNKFRNNNLVWSCRVVRNFGFLYIFIKLLPDDNSGLNYCTINGRMSLLNNKDDSKTVTKTLSNRIIERDGWISFYDPITWSKLTKKRNGYLNSNGQFVVQYEITQVKKIEFCQ